MTVPEFASVEEARVALAHMNSVVIRREQDFDAATKYRDLVADRLYAMERAEGEVHA